MHQTAAKVLAKAAEMGMDPHRIAAGVAERLNKKLDDKYRRLLAASVARTHDAGEHRLVKCGGHEFRKLFEIPSDSYHYWGRRLGYECWQDAGFVNEVLRDHPEWRVRYAKESRITAGIAFDADGAAVA